MASNCGRMVLFFLLYNTGSQRRPMLVISLTTKSVIGPEIIIYLGRLRRKMSRRIFRYNMTPGGPDVHAAHFPEIDRCTRCLERGRRTVGTRPDPAAPTPWPAAIATL